MKIWAYLALAALLLGGVKLAYSAVYGSGWNAAIVEQTALIQEARDDAVEKALTEWENTARIAEVQIVVEERIVEVIRVVEKEIPVIVERIVEVHPECNDLGDDFASLLNAQVNSRSGLENNRPGITTEPHP